MKKTEVTCDKCGMVEFSEYSSGIPKGWNSIFYRVGSYGNVEKHVCQKCSDLLGIESENTNYEKREKDIGERLIDILSEIAQNAQQG